MAADDFVSDRQFDKSAPGIESPVRETVAHGDKFNQDQFGAHINDAPPAPAVPRHPHYISGKTVHEYQGGN